MATLPDLLVQIASRHAVWLEGHKTHIAGQFDEFLRAMESEILARLRNVDDPGSMSARQLNRLLDAVRDTLNSGFGDYETAWRRQMEELGVYEAEFQLRALGQVVRADFTLPTPAQIFTAAFVNPLAVDGVDGGELLEGFYRAWTDKAKRRVENAIRLGIAQGLSTQDIVRRIRGTRASQYADGIIQAARRDVTMMTRTAMQHVASQARQAVYAANDDIIADEEFVAVLDGRTSATCRGLDGQSFPIGEGPIPPLHIACRSVRVPRLKEGLDFLAGAGRQFSRGADGIKRVSADLNYYEWLQTQPAAFQDDVLGPTRGNLLRNGGLSAERFRALQLDRNFRPLTLDQMREREPLAFDRAGL